MRDFNPRPEMRPQAFQIVGATNGGSFGREGRYGRGIGSQGSQSHSSRPEDSGGLAKEKLTRKAALVGLGGNFAEGPLAAVPMKTAAAAGRAAGQKSRIRTKAPCGRICSVCELPSGSCQCRKIGRSGRWFRSGSSIIVNC
jgi:hypothetical protein